MTENVTQGSRISRIAGVVGPAVAIGLAGDYLAAGQPIPLADVARALLFSPVAVPFGTVHAPVPVHPTVLLLTGLAFWPLFAIALVIGYRRPSWTSLSLLFCVSLLGFYGIVHRFDGLMSI